MLILLLSSMILLLDATFPSFDIFNLDMIRLLPPFSLFSSFFSLSAPETAGLNPLIDLNILLPLFYPPFILLAKFYFKIF